MVKRILVMVAVVVGIGLVYEGVPRLQRGMSGFRDARRRVHHLD